MLRLVITAASAAILIASSAPLVHADNSEKERQNDFARVDALMQKKEFKDYLKDQQQTMQQQNPGKRGVGFNLPEQYYTGKAGNFSQGVPQQNFGQQGDMEPVDYPIVFVSFSMPETTITRLMADMDRVGGAVVFRGLIDNDFQKTMQKMRELKSQKGSALIDPTMFKRFDVSQVPTFIIPLEPIQKCFTEQQRQSCGIPRHIKAAGDVTLGYVLDLVERTGSSDEKAVAAKLNSTYRKQK